MLATPACSGGGEVPPVSVPAVPCAGDPWSDDVCIQGGEFTMGHEALPYEPPVCAPGEVCGPGNPPPKDFVPPHKVKLKPFFIDRYPVTNGQYKKCFDAGMCPGDCEPGGCQGGFFDVYHMTDPLLAAYPVATVTFAGADAYCRWAGKRLPTEAEWERAARGPESFDYPWGNDAPDCTKYTCDPGPAPFGWSFYWFLPVGTSPGDVSPEGVHEMVTSAVEVVHDLYDPFYYESSPYEDPQGPSNVWTVSHAARGDLFLRGWVAGNIVFNGVRSPLPAWVRDGSWSASGVRCARSDDGAPASRENFHRLRQRVLLGGRLSPRTGAP
ncbi:MAG: formylglycine-generating enzyme family protein [Myxococcales bacterium]|nr:formylglycine-generating enzyme family protein [Myxococcales bacterium]